MSANTRPYIIELAGKPVAIADTISRAAAAALYAKSLEISARVASASDVLALRTLPVLASEDPVPEPDFESGSLFATAAPEPSAAVQVLPMLADVVATITRDVPPQHAPIAAVLEDLAPGEPVKPAAPDACAPAGVEPDSSASAAADAPALPEWLTQTLRYHGAASLQRLCMEAGRHVDYPVISTWLESIGWCEADITARAKDLIKTDDRSEA